MVGRILKEAIEAATDAATDTAAKVGGAAKETAAKVGEAAKNIPTKVSQSVDAAQQRSYGSQIPDETVTTTQSGEIIIKAMDDEEILALNNVLASNGFTEGLNLGRIGEIFETPMEDMASGFYLETVLKNIKERNKDLFNHLRRDSQSMDEMLAMAETTGYDKIVASMLKRKPGEVAPPEEVLGGLLAVIKIARDIQHGAAKARYMPKEQRPEAYKKLGVLVGMNTNLAASVAGNVSEYGRGMAVVRNLAKLESFDVSAYAEQANKFTEEMDENLIEYHLAQLALLPNAAARAKYADNGFAAKTYDVAMEAYVNALLSSPVTHMVNIAGNASFQALTLLERGVGGMIGNIRTLGGLRNEAGNIGDQMFVGEALAEAHGLMMAQKDAALLMANTMVTGQSSDLMSKIDLRNQRALGSTDNVADIVRSVQNGEWFQSAMDTLGVANRLSGRFLASEDEYFKVVTGRRVLYREAYRAMVIAKQTSLRAGESSEVAVQRGKEAYLDMMTNTPEDVSKLMISEARKLAFQGTPKGVFGELAPYVQKIPGMKFIVPFYNTPTNVINEGFDRTLNIYPLYRALKQTGLPGTQAMPGGNKPISGRELDDAMAKLAVGNSIAFSIYMMLGGDEGDDVYITGGGPNYKTSRVTEGSGVQPYSIGVKQDDGNYKYYSISRFDPISALVIMGADLRDYVKYEDDPKILESLFTSYTLTAANYAGSMPFLQGVAEFSSAIGSQNTETENKITSLLNWSGGVVANVGTNIAGQANPLGITAYGYEFLTGDKYPIVNQTSFKANMERLQDPIRNNTMLPEGTAPFADKPYTELNTFMQGFYKKLQSAKARNAYYSKDLPPKLDFWGNTLYAGDGKVTEMFNPVRISDGKYSELDNELINLSRRGFGTFSLHNKRINGKQLNATQFNTFVDVINNIDSNGNYYDDPSYDPTDTLIDALRSEIGGADYELLETGEDQFSALSNILSERRGLARKYMQATDPLLMEMETMQ